MPFLGAAIGVIVWALANVVYLGMWRRGIYGFGRFAAFWSGFPGTLLLQVLDAEREATLETQPDDEDLLLDDVRRDREARGLTRGGESGAKD